MVVTELGHQLVANLFPLSLFTIETIWLPIILYNERRPIHSINETDPSDVYIEGRKNPARILRGVRYDWFYERNESDYIRISL